MNTTRKILIISSVLLALSLGFLVPAWALLQAVGPAAPLGAPAVMPHGFPGFYEDVNGLQLELCLDPPDPVTGASPCIFDPVFTGNAWSATTGFGSEAFYMMAQADTRPLVVGGKALLVLDIEATYSADGTPVEGNQMTFGRVRVRFNVPNAAHYRVTHPYGIIDIPQTLAAESLASNKDVRVTVDIGGMNPVDPAAAFSGALQAFGPTGVGFIAWDTFNPDPDSSDPALVLRDPLSNDVTAQYIGDGTTPHQVVGSPTGNNLFRIEAQDPATGRWRILSETNLFVVAGKVHVPPPAYDIYTYTNLPVQNFYAVGPINRAATWPLAGSELPNAGVPADPGDPLADPPVLPTPGIPAGDGYPIGFPYWYQDTLDSIPAIVAAGGTPTDATPGIQLTICPGTDPMCISEPVNFASPASVALNVGGESFYWSADADINFRQAIPDRRIDGKLIMALEATFGNAFGEPVDGDQMVFGRIRVRIKVDQPGEYTVLHPYGELVFNVTDIDEGINFTEDIGSIQAGVDPDGSMVGALFAKINPLLRWTTFNPDPALNDPALKVTPLGGPTSMYVGNLLFRHQVLGSPIPDATHPSGFRNYFRVIDNNGLDTMSDLFTVTGKIYDPATFAPGPPPVGAPVAVADIFAIPTGTPAVLNILANDTVVNAPAAISIGLAPANGTAVAANATGTITYTPAPGFLGADTFSYQLTDALGLTSGFGIVNVTVLPAEAIAILRAQLDLRRREWRVNGTSDAPGAILTVFASPDLTGAAVGSAIVAADGRWQLRVRALTNPDPNVRTISIGSSTGSTLLDQPLSVR